MNHIAIVGELKEDARVINGKYDFLSCVIIQRKSGYGQNAGKVFKKFFKAIVFGKDLDAQARPLRKGALVEAAGEADAEAWIPQQGDGSPRACVVIRGTVRPLLLGDSVPAASAPAPVRPPAPAQAPVDDAPEDVPF